MDQQKIAERASTLEKAAVEAQNWVRDNAERVKSCGKSQEDILVLLRRKARRFRMLERAARRRMCVGVFGPSQAGKSYLLSSLARAEDGSVPCVFEDETHDFLKEINPQGGKESTGLVTRFTLTKPEGCPHGYPVHVRLLSETELVKIFANSYYRDTQMSDKVSKEAVQSMLDQLKNRTGTPCAHLSLDAMEDLHEYISDAFSDKARPPILDEVYWKDAIDLAPKLCLEDRVRLYGIIWDDVQQFSDMLRRLLTELEKLNFADEAFCRMDALIPRGASIIDVSTLDKTSFNDIKDIDAQGKEIHVRAGATVDVKAGSALCTITRQNLTAIVAELTMVMERKPADYFDHTDLLDFPGYKARFETTDLRATLVSGKDGSAVEQFFRRGKVAYLFQRYNAERELTSLLLCNSTTDNIPGLAEALESWIIATHGQKKEERQNVKNALFYVLTKADKYFDWGPGKAYNSHWDTVLLGNFADHFGTHRSPKTHWVEEWTTGRPFNNMFLLRNVSIRWDSMMNFEDGKEISIRNEDHHQKMREAFINSSLVRKHFSSPDVAFDELMRKNDGGMEYIKKCLGPVCDPDLKLSQIYNQLITESDKLYAMLSPFYCSGDQAEEVRKKTEFFLNVKKRLSNPLFCERFPELLNSFSMSPLRLSYLVDEARRRYETYKEEMCKIPLPSEEKKKEEDDPWDIPFGGASNAFDLDDMFGNSVGQSSSTQGNENSSGKLDIPIGPGDDMRDMTSFYAETVLEAWKKHMHDKAKANDLNEYYRFPQSLFTTLTDELDFAVRRLNLQKELESNFREIAHKFVGGDGDGQSLRQASFAVGLLNNFISYLGEKSERKVKYNDQEVLVFREVREVEGYPELPPDYKTFDNAKQWYTDWIVAFYGLLMDNATSSEGVKIDPMQNDRLGKILKQIKPEM